MLRVEDLLKPIITESLNNWVYNNFLWERLYTFLDKNLFSIKHVMKNHIKMKETSVNRQGHPHFHTQEKSSTCHQSSTRVSKRSTITRADV